MPRSPRASVASTSEESIVLALFDLANHLQRRGEDIARLAGLTTQQWVVLLQIAGDPNFFAVAKATTSPSDIATARGVSRATTSVAIASLRDLGFVTERVDDRDGRRRHLVVTAAGRAALTKLQPARSAANQRLLAALSTRDRKRFAAYLHDCLTVLWQLHEDRTVAARKHNTRRRNRIS